MQRLISIGELAQQTSTAASALRYYEEVGLLRPSKRVSGQRRYDASAAAVVGVIKFMREIGFSLAEIKQIFSSRSRSPKAWRKLAQSKIDALGDQITKAQAARLALEHSLACPSEDILECPNFWTIVGAVMGGRPMAEVHPS